MGRAARTSARCSCGAVGPLRGRQAAAAGWTTIGGAWVCPPCQPQVGRERAEEFDAQIEASNQARRSLMRACPLLFAAPLLLAAGPSKP